MLKVGCSNQLTKSKFIYVDIGCGKGRAVLYMACVKGIKKSIGVELVSERATYAKSVVDKMKDKYKKNNLEKIIKKSRNWSDVTKLLGMSIHGSSRKTPQKYVKLYDIDISHFETDEERILRVNGNLGKLKRIPINKIIPENENKTISIVILFSIFNTFFRLKPAIRKYIEVLKKDKKVD